MNIVAFLSWIDQPLMPCSVFARRTVWEKTRWCAQWTKNLGAVANIADTQNV